MSLHKDIKNIFDKNTGYAEPEHAINQAESLKSLSVDLYTDSKRFVYELLQNADDSVISEEPVNVGVRLFGDLLVVAHTGKAFDSRDLRGICGVSDGTKKKLVDKTGYKGIGFKAVFGQSNKVIIYSNKEYFRFDSEYPFEWNSKWGDNQEIWEEENERQFSYPWQIIPIYTYSEEVDTRIKSFLNGGEWTVATIVLLSKNRNDVKKAINELSSNVNMFLFLKNIERLDFNLGTPNIITLHRDEEEKTVEIKQNEKIKVSWLIKTIELQVPDDIKSRLKEERNIPEKLLKANETELTFAAKIGEYGIEKLKDNERLLYSYLPTEETKYEIPVLVNGSFVIGANRETLHENSKWNQWLFENISYELLKWIAELVIGRQKYGSYQLIPSKSTTANFLGTSYNRGVSKGFEEIPFILSNNTGLIKINQAIVDFTSISQQTFVTESIIRDYVVTRSNRKTIHTTPFLPKVNEKKFEGIGVTTFDWYDMPKLLESSIFSDHHTALNNVEIIQYLKQLCEAEKPINITNDLIKKWSFILDHKGDLHQPSNIYFPTPDDKNWNDPKSEISFLNIDVQHFLLQNPETRIWLENLGVIEKTDLSYLKKTITKNASTYSTLENSIETILNIFNLYLKGEIGKEELNELSKLKVLTENGNLRPAKSCHFSDSYSPRLKLQSLLNDDIFLSKDYIQNSSEKDELRRFFKMMGISESIEITTYNEKSTVELLLKHQFQDQFFQEDDKYFHPFVTKFKADEYSNLKTLIFLSNTSNFTFSKLFWDSVINNIQLNDFNTVAIAYWGKLNREGRDQGSEVINYIKWYVRNNKCIPTSMKTCHKANDIFINTEDITKLASSYLPVFYGNELSPDYKSFFKFKTHLELSDYLELLNRISLDTTKENNVKKDNLNRIQSIYKLLLDQCVNWGEEKISLVKNWANTKSLLNTKKQFTKSNTLNCFLDGNESIFQDQFYFLDISPDNKKHQNIESFLSYFRVEILKQSDFKLSYTKDEKCNDLAKYLKVIIPYFKIWIESEPINENTKEHLDNLNYKIEALNIYKAEELRINYAAIDFNKSVNIHFNDKNLYVTNPWNSNSVLLRLSEILCQYFYLKGYDKKLDFLLRSTIEEIQQYFLQEGIDIPVEILKNIDDLDTKDSILNSSLKLEGLKDKRQIPSEFYHISKSDYDGLNYVKNIVNRSVLNVIKHLEIHLEYDCSNHYEIAESIIGGITKNGNEITVVARPSDKDFILLFYTSEFDVLEYVDAELWYEDGVNIPKQVTLGQLLKKTGINKIPISNINLSDLDLETFLRSSKNQELEFNAVPYVPQKIAKILSSFANTNGGSIVFGLKETGLTANEIVGLSSDFRTVEITKKAISLLSPIPQVNYDWVKEGDNTLFIINVDKANTDTYLEGQKYIREGAITKLENNISQSVNIVASQQFNRTIAIIIGIEDYALKNEHQISSVKYANSDALKFKNMLVESMNVEESNIHTFLGEQALKSSLEYDLSQLFHYLKEDDRLIFYFVGHGFHNGITNYLSTYDMHKHHISETAVSLNKVLFEPLKKSKCKTAHIFIDACAKSFKDENERSSIADINDEEFILLANDFPYYATFLSCQSGQSSYSSDVLENGIWTHHLIKALSGDVPQAIYQKKFVTDRLLTDYLSESVAIYTKEELGYDQNPKAILDSTNENIIAKID